MKAATLYGWTVALLGLFAGGCITILFILVPFWFSLPPLSMMQWFTDFGSTVGITMLPMEIIPMVLSFIAYYKSRKVSPESKTMWIVINLSNLLILISFLVYFLPVNISFVQQTLPASAVTDELKRWQLLHTVRTILALTSMVVAIRIHASQIKSSL